MATAIKSSVTTEGRRQQEKIVDFSPESLKAPFFSRCSAALLDYIVMIAIPVGWLLASSMFSEHGDVSIGVLVWLIAIVVYLINFIILPLVRGQSIGKFIFGLTILNYDGSNVRLFHLFLRNFVGYLLTFATFGLGFVIAAINGSGRALHDIISGTVVVSGRKQLKN